VEVVLDPIVVSWSRLVKLWHGGVWGVFESGDPRKVVCGAPQLIAVLSIMAGGDGRVTVGDAACGWGDLLGCRSGALGSMIVIVGWPANPLTLVPLVAISSHVVLGLLR
jgi:hypothetical protein